MLKYLRVVRKEKERVNGVHKWCIFLCHGNFKGTELYAAELWVKVITLGPDTTYFLIDKTLIKNSNKTEVPLEGEE